VRDRIYYGRKHSRYLSDKGVVFRIYKEFEELGSNQWVEKRMEQTFLKRTTNGQKIYEKSVQHG
jgi:hypothetical protein